jgi:hypothetical protein
MIGFFKRRRETGMADRMSGPPLSAELKALQDRDFADRLNQRLLEKNATAAGGKVEPIFKSSAGAKPGAATPKPMREAPTAESAKPATTEASPATSPPMTATAAAPAAKIETKTETSPPVLSPVPAPAAAAISPQPEPPALRLDEHRNVERQPVAGLPLVMLAAQFAADRHRSQRRRGAAREPYVNHLLEVAALLATATEGQDSELVVAGLLHDLIEDQGVSADEIARQFGVGVAALVLEVTTDKSLPERERHRLQVAHAADKSPRARLLRVADLTSNLRALRQSPPADWPVDRQRDYLLWAHDVAAGSRGLNPQLDDLFDEAYTAGMAALDTAQPAATA